LSRSSCPFLEARAGFCLPGACSPGWAGSGSGREQSAADATATRSCSRSDGRCLPPGLLCWGRFPIDPALPLLGTVPLGKGKHGAYQNLGDRFPALWTQCQDRSKSHVPGRYHERSLRGSGTEMQRWQGPGGSAARSCAPPFAALRPPHLLLRWRGWAPRTNQQRSWGEPWRITVRRSPSLGTRRASGHPGVGGCAGARLRPPPKRCGALLAGLCHPVPWQQLW